MAQNSSRGWKVLAALTFAGAMAGCSITLPVAVVADSGEVMKGEATTSLVSGGTFSASNAQTSCSGQYDASPGSATVSFGVRCSDGRSGVGVATRDTPRSGSGTINMTDGTKARFVFGAAANSF